MTKDCKSIRNGNIWTKVDNEHQENNSLKSFLESKNAITLPDIFETSVQKFGDSNCLGTRKLLERRKIESNGKVIEKLVLGDYEWKSYLEISNCVLKVAAGLKTFGFQRGHRVVIFAETREEWLISTIACLRQGLSVVTLYTNLCNTGLCHGIDETEVDTIFTSYELLPRLLKIIPKCDIVKNIIVFEDQLEGIGDIPSLPNINILSFSSLLSLGDTKNIEKPEIDPEDEAFIMYTSGTTGKPKGVVVSHMNIYYSLIAYSMQTCYKRTDRYIAYLPLAHALELFSEISLLSIGVTIAYSSPFTLTNSSLKISKGTKGDASIVRPTAISAVPLILDRIIKSVSEKVTNQGKLKAKLFNKALNYKQNRSGDALFGRILDMMIFNKVKAELGGSVRIMIVGGAPLSNETASMIRAMFGCILQTGYGCTETVACATSMDVNDTRLGHVGVPNPFVKIKLEDWEDGDFRTSDQPSPRGEIIVGGKCVTKGYFKLPSETEEVYFEKDGIRWFRTGDIGQFDEIGVLYVIDRKKDLAKLKHGEYVSLGFIESRLKACPLVENICVLADSNASHTVAVIVPSLSVLGKIASELHLPPDCPKEKMCSNDKVIGLVLEKLQNYGKQCGLSKWDIPQAIHLTTSQWTPDSGLVTAALKLKRKAIQNEYYDEIKALYVK